MIRIADINDSSRVAVMMMAMYSEIAPAHYSKTIGVYIDTVVQHLADPRDTVYVDDAMRGFFIVRDETEAIAPTLHRYNGIRVFIGREHRKSNLLAQFYDRLFQDYPNGDILGSTEIESEHIRVLDKRHTLIAKVYRLNRKV